MKYKTIIPILLIMQVVAFIVVCSVCALAGLGDLQYTIDDMKKSPLFMAGMMIMAFLFFISAFISMFLLQKIERLTDIESREEILDKETLRYKQATDEFVKSFKVTTNNLL